MLVQAESKSAAGLLGVLQSLAYDHRCSRVVWSELLGAVGQNLDPCQESLDPTEEAGATFGRLQAISTDAVVSLANHAHVLSQKQKTSAQSLWAAECATVEAIIRKIRLELSRGDTVHAVQLIQAVCEWFSCPRLSCAPLFHYTL